MKTSKYFYDKFLKLRSEYDEKVTALRKEAETHIVFDKIDLIGKPVKIVGQKGWNIGTVKDIRLSYDFKIVAYVNNRSYVVEDLVEPNEQELRRYNLNNKINEKI